MTTTLWIVGMIAMAGIGAWIGYVKGMKMGFDEAIQVGRKFTDEENARKVEQANIESAENAKDADAPDCEGDDCRIVGKTFFGGDGIE